MLDLTRLRLIFCRNGISDAIEYGFRKVRRVIVFWQKLFSKNFYDFLLHTRQY